MKKWIFAGLMIIASIVCAGWLDRPENYNCNTIHYKVSPNETVWEICSKYYHQQNRYKNFDEMVWFVRKDNELIGPRFIHAGDTLTINLYTRKEIIKW